MARVKARAPGFHIQDNKAFTEIENSYPPRTESVLWDRNRRTQITARADIKQQGIHGPAILTQFDSTTLIAPGWHASLKHEGSLLLKKSK